MAGVEDECRSESGWTIRFPTCQLLLEVFASAGLKDLLSCLFVPTLLCSSTQPTFNPIPLTAHLISSHLNLNCSSHCSAHPAVIAILPPSLPSPSTDCHFEPHVTEQGGSGMHRGSRERVSEEQHQRQRQYQYQHTLTLGIVKAERQRQQQRHHYH